MSRWIDADKLHEAMQWAIEHDMYDKPFDYIAEVLDAPSIDIVRCGECKFKRIYDNETKYYYCALEDRPNRQWSIDETDYCSWGERRE